MIAQAGSQMEPLCPLCSEKIQDDTHFHRHLKYKKFLCGQNGCSVQFYTAKDRDDHCSMLEHSRSFSVVTNSYIELVIKRFKNDAQFLINGSIEELCEIRNKSFENEKLDQRRGSMKSTKDAKPKTPTPNVVQKTSISLAPKRKNADDTAVDSTTADFSFNQNKRKATPRSTANRPPVVKESPKSVEEFSKFMEKMNESNSQDLQQHVKCELCHKDVILHYLKRRGHVAMDHMDDDVDQIDYANILNTKMEQAFPRLPNTDNSCQLCMNSTDIRRGLRRQHVEELHSDVLPVLLCPMAPCPQKFQRQTSLSKHMREIHKVDMSLLKNPLFQNNRARRNTMIQALITKCFPMAPFDCLRPTETKAASKQKIDETLKKQAELLNVAVNSAFGKDIRITELNKVRRAPAYNQSSSSSSDDDDGPSTSEGRRKKNSGSRLESECQSDIAEADVIMVAEIFNKRMEDNLRVWRSIKVEPGSPEQQPNVEQADGTNVIVPEPKMEESVADDNTPEIPTPSSTPIPTSDERASGSRNVPRFVNNFTSVKQEQSSRSSPSLDNRRTDTPSQFRRYNPQSNALLPTPAFNSSSRFDRPSYRGGPRRQSPLIRRHSPYQSSYNGNRNNDQGSIRYRVRSPPNGHSRDGIRSRPPIRSRSRGGRTPSTTRRDNYSNSNYRNNRKSFD